MTWKDHKTLKRISESISGFFPDGIHRVPYYIRQNKTISELGSDIEYSLEKPIEPEIPDEIYHTSAGEIDMSDYGEFGGELRINKKIICNGNFSTIFEYNGEKYVVDSLAHMGTYRFRLIRINNDGTIDTVYSTVDDNPFVFGGTHMAGYYIGEDFTGQESVFFLCDGIEKVEGVIYQGQNLRRERYLLIYNTHREEENQVIRIDLPTDKVEFSDVTSIWCDGIMLAIGCDKQVVMVCLPKKDKPEYWTGEDVETVEKILAYKRELFSRY